MALAVSPNASGGIEADTPLSAAVWNANDSHSDLSDLLVVHEAVRFPDLAELAGSEGNEVRCALDLSASPRERRRCLSVLSGVDGLANVTGIEAPVAVFASVWSANPTSTLGQPLRIVALERHGICSMLVANTVLRRILSVGIVESADDLEELTHKAVIASSMLSGEVTVNSDLPWAQTLAHVESVHTVALRGSIEELFTSRFGSLVQPEIANHAVLYGLTRIETLHDWTTTWPTTRIHLGDGWTRQPGPLRDDVEEHLTRLRPDASLRFSDSATGAIGVQAGSVSASGCVIPERLGTQPRLRLVDDGRLLLLGPSGTRPLALELHWPILASRPSYHIELRSASAVGVELTDPRIVKPAATSGSTASTFG